MKPINESINGRPTLLAAGLLLLALALFGPVEARAQWTTNGNDIGNTNTGNVGVGTGSPSAALHVKGNLSSPLTGTVSVTQNSAAITGNGTSFTTQLAAGDSVKVGNEVFTVSSISSNTSLTLDSNYLGASASGLTAFRDPNLLAVDNGDGANKLTVSKSGQLGLGVTNPGVLLDVSGAAPSNSFIMRVANTVPGGEIFQAVNNFGNEVSSIRTDPDGNGFIAVNDSSGTRKIQLTSVFGSYFIGGNVGIGTQTPGYTLDVSSTGQWAARFKKTDATNGGILIDAATGFNPNVALSVGGTVKWYMNNNSSNGDALQFWESGGLFPRLTVTQAGTVGIGMATPGTGYKLDVNGSVNSTGFCIGGVCKTNWSQVGGQWTTSASGTSIYYNGGDVGIGTSTPLSGLTGNGGMELYVPSAVATFKIGTGLPGKNNAQVRFSGASGDNWAIGSDVATHSGSRDFHFYDFAGTPGARVTVQSSTGNVGIGTNTPGAKLDVMQANATGVRVLSGSASAHVNIMIGRTAAEGTLGVAGGPGQYTTDAAAGDVVLRTEDSAKRILITNGVSATTLAVSEGKVGIGKNNPSVALDVVGAVNATGAITGATINAVYQDVAEWVPSSQKLSAGTVVVLDKSETNHVLASTKSYDTKVAGVVSAEPGVILGVAGEGKLKVATTGRVRVKVDATRSPVEVGDLLVTSEVEGVAMKSVEVDLGGVKIHRPGTIIGKALEALASGTGEILVLLSLQ